MSLPIRMTFEPIRQEAANNIGVAYSQIGTALENPARILSVSNLTDAALMFSTDGVNDHFALPTMGFLLIDAAANQAQIQGCFFASGTKIFVKEIGNPTTGDVFVSVLYATSLSNT